MQVNASPAETQIATLLAGVTTNIMNHVANLEQELTATQKIISDLHNSLRESDKKVKDLEKELEELTVQLYQK